LTKRSMDKSISNSQKNDAKNENSTTSACDIKPIQGSKVEVNPDEIKHQTDEKIVHRREISAIFSGPLPLPALLAEYDKIIPNGADRILVLAEKQQSHRHCLEKSVVECDTRRSDRGLILGFVLALLLEIGSIYLLATGRNINGLVVFFSTLTTLIGTFIYADKSRKQDLLKTNKSITEEEE